MSWFLSSLLLTLWAAPSPLLDYQQMEKLKEKIRGLIVSIEVSPKPLSGMNPDYVAKRFGQGVCLELPGGKKRILVSQFLVEDAASLRVKAHGGKWVTAQTDTHSQELAVHFLRVDQDQWNCPLVSLAPPEMIREKALVFSVDNPEEQPNIFWGFVESFAEVPVNEFLLSTTGLPLSYPLFDSEGRLVAMNLRVYADRANIYLAVSAEQLRKTFFPKKVPAPKSPKSPTP